MKDGLSVQANLLLREGRYKEALSLYREIKSTTGSVAWDWNIRSLEKKLNLERTTFIKKDLCTVLAETAEIERVYVANLKHREDRRRRITMELRKFGIGPESLSVIDAVHGVNNERALQLFEHFKIADSARFESIASTPEEVLKYDRAHSTPGIIGYLLTQELIIKDAIARGYKRILILDDDVFFAENACALIDKFFSGVKNWKIVHLGASEHSPPDSKDLQERLSQAKQCGYYNPIPYKTCGSFAVAYDASVFSKLLQLIGEFVGVYDRAILSYFYKKYPTECFTLRPAACCADVSESDIQEARNMSEHAMRMGWDISRYAEYLNSTVRHL